MPKACVGLGALGPLGSMGTGSLTGGVVVGIALAIILWIVSGAWPPVDR